MEAASTNLHKGIKGYYNGRRGYEKVNAYRKTKSVRLGGSIKLTRRLKFSEFTCTCLPKKFLIAFQDSYVNLMNKIGNTRVITDGNGGGFGGGAADSEFGGRALKEYDEKMIIEIYKSIIIAQDQLVPHRDAQIICS